MATSVKTQRDTKVEGEVRTRAELSKKVYASVSFYAEANEKGLWGMADDMQLMTRSHNYGRRDAEAIFRENFCKFYGIKWDGKTDDKRYNSFSVVVIRLGLVGSLPAKLYAKYRNSGETFTSIWAYLASDTNNLKKILAENKDVWTYEDWKKRGKVLKGETKSKGEKANLQKEAEQGVVNADTYVKATTNTSFKKPNKILNSPKSFTSPTVSSGFDTDKDWIRKGRAIMKSDTSVFIRLIESFVNAHLMKDNAVEVIKELIV